MGSEGGRLEWRIDFGAENPAKRLVVVAIAVVAATVGMAIGGVLLSVIGLVVVFLSTAELFLPLRYVLDESGAQSKCGLNTSAIAWQDVKRLIRMTDGVRLSPLENPSRMDEFRGVYLRFRDNSEEVSGKIRQFWDGDTSALERESDRAGDGRAVGEAGSADQEA